MKQTILDNITDRLTTKPTSQRFVYNFFSQRTNFLIQFLMPTHKTHFHSFATHKKANAEKNERVFYSTALRNPAIGIISLNRKGFLSLYTISN
jgi:hypothetical protein